MPSLIGAIAAIIALAVKQDEYPQFPIANQFAYIGITLGLAISGAIFTGFAIMCLANVNEKNYFQDKQDWEVNRSDLFDPTDQPYQTRYLSRSDHTSSIMLVSIFFTFLF
jgi:hypothetical protein